MKYAIPFAWMMSAAGALACSCLAPDLDRSFETSKLVFVGKPVKVEKEQGSIMHPSFSPVFFTFDVMGVLKGEAKDSVIVQTAGHSAACGTTFKLDSLYLIFSYAIGEDASEPYSTGLCAGNRPIASWQDPVIQELQGGSLRGKASPRGVPSAYSGNPLDLDGPACRIDGRVGRPSEAASKSYLIPGSADR